MISEEVGGVEINQKYYSYSPEFSSSQILDNAEANRPFGTTTTPNPIIKRIDIKILHPALLGYTELVYPSIQLAILLELED